MESADDDGLFMCMFGKLQCQVNVHLMVARASLLYANSVFKCTHLSGKVC